MVVVGSDGQDCRLIPARWQPCKARSITPGGALIQFFLKKQKTPCAPSTSAPAHQGEKPQFPPSKCASKQQKQQFILLIVININKLNWSDSKILL
jgi:hypothetical protein